MRLLLDTHAYLWWLADDVRLGGPARAAIGDVGNVVHVSAASVWEAAIKRALGRLDVGDADLVAQITANGFVELPVTAAQADLVGALPPHHNDPFDRLLVVQARREQLRLVTADAALRAYDVELLAV